MKLLCRDIMRIPTYVTLILLMLISCSKSENKVDNLQEITVDFAKAKVPLPKLYHLVAPSRYKKIIQSTTLPEFVELKSNMVDALVEANYVFEIYIDSTNSSNTIWFMDGPAVRLTKDMISFFISSTEKRFNSEFTPYGASYKRVENTFYDGRHNQLLKVKYEILYDDAKTYTTEYLVTSLTKTIGITVNNESETDFEELIKKIKME